MSRILVVNGPNLNLTGLRQTDIYGHTTLGDILADLKARWAGSVEIDFFQSNHEGAIIDCLHQAGYGPGRADGIVLNAGAYTHTSLAIADAIAAIPVPVVEVHLSNVAAREPIRRTSLIAPVCAGTIAGFGPAVYDLAVRALIGR